MDRVFRFSTFGGDSSANATRALDPAIDLTPVAADLIAQGYRPAVGETGHLWGIRDGSKLWRVSRPQLERGDFGARISRVNGVESVTHVYEVLGVLPDPTVPHRLNIDWQGGTATWPISIIFGPATRVGPVPYRHLQTTHGWQAPGGNWEALFVPTDVNETFAALIGAAPVAPPSAPAPASGTLVLNNQRSEGATRQQRSRTGRTAFKEALLANYGLMCAACHVTGRALLDGAHLIDEGWHDDQWDIGLPMCPNHHRLLDRGILRLRPGGTWDITDALYAPTVTRQDLAHLTAQPHPDAVAFKAANPIPGKYTGVQGTP